VGKLVAVDLAGRTGRETIPDLSQEEAVSAIGAAVETNDLRDLVMVGHDVSAPLVLKAAAAMAAPPKRIVFLGGIFPGEGKAPIDVLSLPFRLALMAMTIANGSRSKGIKLPKHVISNILCSGLDAQEVIKVMGFFQPVPVRVLKDRVNSKIARPSCPITYVVLTLDRLLPIHLQRRMALRLGEAEVEDLGACHAAMLHRPKEVAQILLRYA
jgi:pimeloyl-ACP methyl ester carboxylesterase